MAALLHITGPVSRADLDTFPDDGRRYELVDGGLLVSPSPRLRHQRVVTKLVVALQTWADDHGGESFATLNVDFDDWNHLEPDVVWLDEVPTEDVLSVDRPALVVEVSSPATKRFDRGVKRYRYLTSGVQEVWLVDLDSDTVERHTDPIGEPVVLGRGDRLTSPLLPGFDVAVDDVLGDPPT